MFHVLFRVANIIPYEDDEEEGTLIVRDEKWRMICSDLMENHVDRMDLTLATLIRQCEAWYKLSIALRQQARTHIKVVHHPLFYVGQDESHETDSYQLYIIDLIFYTSDRFIAFFLQEFGCDNYTNPNLFIPYDSITESSYNRMEPIVRSLIWFLQRADELSKRIQKVHAQNPDIDLHAYTSEQYYHRYITIRLIALWVASCLKSYEYHSPTLARTNGQDKLAVTLLRLYGTFLALYERSPVQGVIHSQLNTFLGQLSKSCHLNILILQGEYMHRQEHMLEAYMVFDHMECVCGLRHPGKQLIHDENEHFIEGEQKRIGDAYEVYREEFIKKNRTPVPEIDFRLYKDGRVKEHYTMNPLSE